MKYNFRNIAGPILALVIFVFAIALLQRLLQQYHYNEIRDAFHSIPAQRILLSFGFTACSYFVLTLYDSLAFLYTGKPLAYRKIALASFVSYTFANNTGTLSILASSSIRYRFYSGWGFSGIEIARIIWFCLVSFWLGYFFLAGISFLTAPPAHIFSLPFARKSLLQLIGLLFLFLVGSYLVLSLLKTKPIHFRKWELEFPPARLAIGQVAVAALDLFLVTLALYVLLPEMSISFGSFVSLFLLAVMLGLISNVPGGLGVFEGVMLLMLTPYAEGTDIISSLLLFRTIYYLLPLALSICVLGGLEIHRSRTEITRLSAAVQKSISVMLPQVLALATIVAGGILLFSGTMPPLSNRVAWLIHLLPLPVLELSHFLGSIAGMGLLVLASGLRRRLDMAYYFTIVLLILGVTFSLLKGLDYEEAAFLTILLIVLSVSHSQFYRKASILKEPIKPSWFFTLLIVFCGSIGLGLFVYRHQSYSNELWWQFALHGDAPRFMRASVGAAAVIVFFALARLFKPYQPVPATPRQEHLDTAAQIAARCPETRAYLALLGDKTLLFSESKQSFLMYGVKGRSWIAMGDPVGVEQEAVELIWKFRNLAERFDCWPVFHEVGAENLSRYVDLGMTVLKIGEEGRVDLTEFTLAGSRHKGLRYVHNRLGKKGCQFEIIPPEKISGILPELKEVSDEWLQEKQTGEKGFSLGFFDERYLSYFPIAVIRFEDRIMAFTNLWPGGDKAELSIDLMRYRNDAPNGIMDFIFCEIMIWAKSQGYKWFNVGMVPLAGLEPEKAASLWANIGTFVFRHGEHFYNFQGLRSYKDKFAPVWQPRYLVFPGGLQLPSILANLTALIGGNLKRIITR